MPIVQRRGAAREQLDEGEPVDVIPRQYVGTVQLAILVSAIFGAAVGVITYLDSRIDAHVAPVARSVEELRVDVRHTLDTLPTLAGEIQAEQIHQVDDEHRLDNLAADVDAAEGDGAYRGPRHRAMAGGGGGGSQ